MTIRPATAADGAALRDIYAQYIDTAVTFEYILPSVAAFAGRIGETLRDYPYLVCERDGRPVGYAYAHRLSAREAYAWSAELSVYVDAAHCSRGCGKALYAALLELLRLQGVHAAFACVTLPNERSEGLHRAFGFRPAGVFTQAGYKNGRWHDVGWFEKRLAPSDAPAPFCPFSALSAQTVRRVLSADGRGT